MSPSTNAQSGFIEIITISTEATTITGLHLPYLTQTYVSTTIKDLLTEFKEYKREIIAGQTWRKDKKET